MSRKKRPIDDDDGLGAPRPLDKKIRDFLVRRAHDWTNQDWEKFANKHAWMWQEGQAATTETVLNTIAKWIGFRSFAHLHESEHSPETLLMRELLLNSDLHDILRVPEESLVMRLWIIRSILERNFLKKPAFLLHPFEHTPLLTLKMRRFKLEALGREIKQKGMWRFFLPMPEDKFNAILEHGSLFHPKGKRAL
ncbi:MAG: hypothetical protein WC787_04795 [Patescibacteria group bacterium]|jgi:hypothetical protein